MQVRPHAVGPKAGPRTKRFTSTSLGALAPGDHTDPSTQGLQLRVREKAGGTSRTWRFRYTWRGEWVRLTIGHFPSMPLAEAREVAHSLRKNLDDGIDPRRARPKRNPKAAIPSLPATISDKHSIEFLISEFTERHLRATRKRPEYAERILAKDVLPEWRGRDARTIEPYEVIELLDRIVDRGSTVMANRAAAVLGQLFKFGIHRRIVTASPVQLLYRPGGKERPRERSLTDKEIAALLSIEPQPRWERLHRAINLLLLTGQRRGELALTRRVDVDLGAKLWRIPDEVSKTGRGHVVPLSDWAVDEFRALLAAGKSKWLFPSGGVDDSAPADPKILTRNLARAFDRSQGNGAKGRRPSPIKSAGEIGPFTLHDLRRTCRTGLARLKVAPHIAERVLNHVQEKIPGTYDVHDYLEEKREALDKWAAHLRTLLT